MNDVYRLHIRPTLEGRRIDTALGWCIENRVAGIPGPGAAGWVCAETGPQTMAPTVA